MNKLSLSRREFIKASSIGFAFPYVAKESWASASPNDIVNHASFGGAGMAGSDLGQIKKVTQKLKLELLPRLIQPDDLGPLNNFLELKFMMTGEKC